MAKHCITAAAAATTLVCLAAFGGKPSSAASPHTPFAGRSPTAPSRFVPGPCPKPPKPIEALSSAKCGFLKVPENRARPGGRTIELAAAVIPAVSAKPAADPVVFMAGGPGGDAFDDIPFLIDSGLNKDRELIVMAQRGNLYDQPNLACPEIDRFNEKAVGFGWDATQAKRLMLKAVKECRDRLTADGTDLSAYNSAENAADFADLRTALGIPEWNVYGYSYGTNLALTYLRRHPQGIRAVALDSPSPPQVTILPWGWSSAREGIGNVLDACAAEPRCKSRYPDLRQTLNEQVRKLEAQPLTLNARPPSGGDPVNVVLDGGTLLNMLVAFNVKPVDLPAALQELSQGNPQRFAQARAKDSVQPVGHTAHGLTQSVACGEWAPGTSESDVLNAGHRAFPGWPETVLAQVPQLPFQYDVCRVWNVKDRAAEHRVATVSSVPAIIISGTFDMKTGASYAKDAARTLSRSTSVLIPGIGHWVVPQSPCAQRVLASFFAGPTAPDTGCVAGLTPQPFTITPK
ncbi:alpha/beta hydrolase [Streptomyces sp. ISL-11]|uniref:alpha/beta hydrolase n=1 Tax=Streptomyces sp. ISL-11 TaxID=2819174 RepID=UPI001BE5C155|nr:alpha/beta fold hydrolase [Streptomyces sp. ISL-11]MBT2382242.1 alpha/beta fold hydrolase [Streptomyces sp. ISL-11]